MNSGHAFSPPDSRWAPRRSPFLFSLSPHTSCSTLHGIFFGASLLPPLPPPKTLMCWCAWQAMSAAEERTPVYCNKTVVLHLEFVCSVCFQSRCPVCLRQSQSLSQNTDNSSFSGFATTHKRRVSSAPDLETLTLTLLSGFGLWQHSMDDAHSRAKSHFELLTERERKSWIFAIAY